MRARILFLPISWKGRVILFVHEHTLFVFMWRHHFSKLQICNPTGVLVSSDIRPYQNLAFYDV